MSLISKIFQKGTERKVPKYAKNHLGFLVQIDTNTVITEEWNIKGLIAVAIIMAIILIAMFVLL